MDERIIKIRLLDFLIDELQPKAISHEVIFANGKRRADMVLIQDATHAIEIKSPIDNLDKIEEQIFDYIRCFEKVSVATTAQYLSAVRAKVPSKVGLILVGSGIRLIRKPQIIKRLDRFYLSSFLSKSKVVSELKKLRLNFSYSDGVDDLRKTLCDYLTIEALKREVRKEMLEKYSFSYNLFLKEKGANTVDDDLLLFNRLPKTLDALQISY